MEEACRLGARLARGGEFSLRSFLAGKIDLLQAEAVVGIVDARTPKELSQALDRMAGGVGRLVEQLREYLLDLVADIEAAIDFADDLAPMPYLFQILRKTQLFQRYGMYANNSMVSCIS